MDLIISCNNRDNSILLIIQFGGVPLPCYPGSTHWNLTTALDGGRALSFSSAQQCSTTH